jgi:stress response protein YsnF
MSHKKVVAVYGTAAHAEAAVSTLKSAGYSASDISVTRNEDDAPTAELSEPGFWQRLFGRDIGLHEAAAYGHTVVRGGVVVSVRVPESEVPRVIELLDTYQPVDVLDRARTYGSLAAAAPKVVVPPPTSAADVRKDEEVVRLAEEQLNVGKRQVDAGITRLRRFSVEKPVEANVTLHEEHAEVIRRAISDPGYLKDIDWCEQTIEVMETAEQPVVNKTVRVTEEVVIRRRGSDHIETVHDTVRRQQLEVEKVSAETIKK